jgi:RNase H-fold protein (predicted Holliday junction resolvase)
LDKFLDAYNQGKLNQEDINHLNKSIINNEIEAVIMSLPTKKNTGPDVLMAESYQTFKEELI